MNALPLDPPGSAALGQVSRLTVIARGLEMIGNTAPFDVSGHPACAVPAGLADGLPVGTMIIGRHFDGATVLRVAHAFEQAVGRFPAPRTATERSSA